MPMYAENFNNFIIEESRSDSKRDARNLGGRVQSPCQGALTKTNENKRKQMRAKVFLPCLDSARSAGKWTALRNGFEIVGVVLFLLQNQQVASPAVRNCSRVD